MDPRTLELEQRHVRLVIEANKVVNLTRIASEESAMLLHVEDSLTGIPEVEQALPGEAADLGSGAGFPGIPLAVETNKKFLLVESVGKKTKVLHSIVDELGLSDQISIYNGRIEELALQRSGEFTLVTARALTALNSLIELASPLLAIGGILVAYKSGNYQDELQAACNIQHKLGMKHRSTREFTLSDGETRRSIIVFEKVEKPSVKLPRRSGMAQKHPYL